MIKKISLVLILVLLIVLAKVFGVSDYLSFTFLKSQQSNLISFYEAKPLLMISGYFLVYVLATALSIPGATILTLGAGAIFGLGYGIAIVSFASSLGATCAFLVTRYLFRGGLEKKFSNQLKAFNDGVDKEGAFYLFTLRLVPLFPFFVINMLMGLTRMKALTFYGVSQIGMLAGTFVYVNAGTQLAKLESASGILSFNVLISFVLLGIFPLIAKKFTNSLKAKKVYAGFKKPETFDYNMVAIGAGAAGLVSTYIGAAVKAKVALIEKHKMGGDCLNTGCVPSKALIKSSKVAATFKKSDEFGIDPIDFKVNFQKVMNRVHRVIGEIAPHDSVERYTNLGVECIQGEAEIISPWEIKVGDRILRTKSIILATGAGPLIPKLPGLTSDMARTSENLWDLKELPEHLVVLGGGPIGCEMAQAFRRLGSQVTLIEAGDKILQREDEDVSSELTSRMTSEGVKILTLHKAIGFKLVGTQKIILVETRGKQIEIEYSECLLALGRRANTKMKGLDKLNLEISPSGTFVHDDYLRTKFPNVYVCGDCAGPFQFTHTAAHQAWYASVNALFSPFKSFKVDYRVIPWVTFTDPEVARVGLNEAEAKSKNIPYELTTYGLDDLDRAIAEGEAYGKIKVLTAPNSDKILGVTITGSRGGELLAEFVLAMKWGIGLNKILGTIHSYPTFPEAVKYLAGNWKKERKPEKILKMIEKFHAWRRT